MSISIKAKYKLSKQIRFIAVPVFLIEIKKIFTHLTLKYYCVNVV